VTQAGVTMPSLEDYEAAQKWFHSEGITTLPAAVVPCLRAFFEMSAAKGDTRKSQNLLRELWLAMGILPRSERRGSKKRNPLPRDPAARARAKMERLQDKLARLQQTEDRHRNQIKKNKKEMKRTEKQMQGLQTKIDDDDEETQEEREQSARESQALIARFLLGTEGRPDPQLARVDETLMTGSCIELVDEIHPVFVPPESLDGTRLIQSHVESRTRYDFRFVMRRLEIPVEKKVVIDRHGERRMLSASTNELGPPRFAVTWDFMVHVVILVVLYAMPFHRLGRLLSTQEKRFSAGALYKMTHYAANHSLPIVLHLFDELSDAGILMGDDTSSRVLEVQRFFDSNPSDEPAPWAKWRNPDGVNEYDEQKSSSPSHFEPMEEQKTLAERCANEFGFCFPRRKGEGNKESFHTTVLAGKSDLHDPRSLIIFYRSHLGSLGNLIEVLLRRRNPSCANVIIQSDLSTTNLVKDPKLREKFSIQQVGCMAHARRPFARYEHEDPELAGFILTYFSELSYLEKTLDEWGRNELNVKAVRSVNAREIWDYILQAAEMVTRKWSKETKLGEGARYILRHKDALLVYLDNPHLAPTNNLSERSLRMEKIIQANSMFRATLEGRCCFDILRTLCQTANVAGAAVNEYLLSILKTPAEEIQAHPEKYTPYAWVKAGGKTRSRDQQDESVDDLLTGDD
jgi:hypothetical protein